MSPFSDSWCEDGVVGGPGLKRWLQSLKKNAVLGTGGCLAVRGRVVLSAILLTLHEGQLPANQLPSRADKLDRVLGNGEGRGETGAAIQSAGIVLFGNNGDGDNTRNGTANR